MFSSLSFSFGSSAHCAHALCADMSCCNSWYCYGGIRAKRVQVLCCYVTGMLSTHLLCSYRYRSVRLIFLPFVSSKTCKRAMFTGVCFIQYARNVSVYSVYLGLMHFTPPAPLSLGSTLLSPPSHRVQHLYDTLSLRSLLNNTRAPHVKLFLYFSIFIFQCPSKLLCREVAYNTHCGYFLLHSNSRQHPYRLLLQPIVSPSSHSIKPRQACYNTASASTIYRRLCIS